MPCEAEYGLLPGRGGRGIPMPCDVANGLFPGRGAGAPGFAAGFAPGLGAALGFAAGFAGCASGVAGCDSGFGAAGFAPGFGTAGFFAAGFGAAGFLSEAAGFFGAAGFFAAAGFFSAAGLAALSLAASGFTPSASNAAFTLRATGGATLEDEDFTNSPMSLSFASTTLLSMPRSAAISCTRGFATFLLSEVHATDRREPCLLFGPHREPFMSDP